MIVHRTALLPLPAEHLFDIIEAAEHYPRFLPWCAGAHIVCRDDDLVSADLQVKWGGMNFEMRTRNPKRRPEYMAIHLERGPFKRFEGEWRLTVLTPEACKVAFNLDYEFENGLMTRVAGPMFKRLTDTLVEAFIQRALATPLRVSPPVTPPPAPPAPVAQPTAVVDKSNGDPESEPPATDTPPAEPPATAPDPPRD